ncbi:MAG: hypothetical protein A2W28_00020 [Gammaproteobacteria bacterium RBG_16_51_14]|nr:MAG: hypothetical protein A2W28_00020 [Gammaproteobacteria bacterium RBG_16_51_14]
MKKSAHILVVDDDERICNLLERYLCKEGYTVSVVSNGEQMRGKIEQDMPDLVLLDLVLPDEDGLTLARELRKHPNLGIIILTGKGDIMEKVVGLEVGADDYISKPFDKRELLARIHSVLRRLKAEPDKSQGQTGNKSKARFADWVLDLAAHELISPDGREVHLTSYEFKLLSLFVTSSNWVLTRDQILEKIADRDWNPDDRSIDVVVVKLRKKLERDPLNPNMIKTIRGEGYKFTPHVHFE